MVGKNILLRLLINLVLAFLLGSFLMAVLILLFHQDKTEYEDGIPGFLAVISVGLFWNLILTISSLTIFLNLKKRIRENKFLSGLTFFFLPVLVSIFIETIGIKLQIKTFETVKRIK